MGRAYFTGKHYEEAVSAIENIETQDILQLAFLAASCGYLNDTKKALSAVEAARKLNSAITIKEILSMQHYGKEADQKHFTDGLRLAGFSDG